MPYIKEEPKKKDEERLEEMQREIDEAIHGGDESRDGEAPAEGPSPYAAEDAEGAEGAGAAAGDAEDAEAPDPGQEIEQLREELKAKEERVLRLQADFENFRRRTAKEREELSAFVTQEFLKDMLPLLDNFDRAMAADSKDPENFRKGVEMIAGQFREALKKHGLEPIETEGKMFDPNFHQAVMRVEDPEREDESIARELQKGYMAKGRVIRPSMVQVVANN